MLGTIVNAGAIILGSLLGCIFKNFIPEKYAESLLKGVALAVIIIGIKLGLQGENLILLVISILVGTLIGEMLGIENRLDKLGEKLENKFFNSNTGLAKGFVTCTLIYCIGSMAIVGSIQSGLTGNHEILYTKSVLDGITAITMASTLGIGVLLSSVSVFIYQGTITLLAGVLKSILTEVTVNEMTAVGGVLIMAIGLNFLDIKRIKVGNMLPAVFIPIIYFIIFK